MDIYYEQPRKVSIQAGVQYIRGNLQISFETYQSCISIYLKLYRLDNDTQRKKRVLPYITAALTKAENIKNALKHCALPTVPEHVPKMIKEKTSI